MSDHEQMRPVYLDTGDGIVTVNSRWSESLGSYQFILTGSKEALEFLYPDNDFRPDEQGNYSITLQEEDYVFEDMKAARRWLRDLMMGWRDSGAEPCLPPEDSAEEDEQVVVAPTPVSNQTLPDDTMSTAVFGSIADVRQEVHNRAMEEREDADFSMTQIAQDQSQPEQVDEDAETVAETNRSEAQTEAISAAEFNQQQDTIVDENAETVPEGEETVDIEPDSQRFAQEMSGADVVADIDPAEEDGDWAGSEVTMIPTAKDAEPAEAEASDGSWDGAEQTMIGGAAPADGEWDGAEKTMLGGSDPMNWDGSEGTVVGQASGEWDGAEATMVGAPAGAVPRNDSDRERSGSSTTGSRTGTGTGTKTNTNPSFNDGWHLKGDPGPCTGQIWGDYEVGGKLGEGGMGTVYRGRQFSLRRRVAIKVLPPHLSNDPQMRERFELEAQSASILNSPHVVQVFAAGTEQGNAYYVMEYVEGTDLHEVVKEHLGKNEQLDPHVAADYVIQAGRGLIEAQKHDFVHRDIKPPNLMLTRKGAVKIADFGIVKVMGESSLTMTGTAIGTPAYCSPEQGSGTGCDGRSDIYSMGVVFYELLTLQKPFDGNTGNALIYQHTYTEPPMLTDINPDCPESYQTVVLKCMQKNPDDRYQTAQELVDDLERVRLGTAPLAQVFGTGADAMMKAQGLSRAKKWPIFVGLAAAVLVLGIGYYFFQQYQEDRNRIQYLKEQLSYLNDVKSPEDGAEEYILELANLAGWDDPDVSRWDTKVKSLTILTESLSRLDEPGDPSAKVLDETRMDYESYVGYFGDGGFAADRWQRKLKEADEKIASTRVKVGEELRIDDKELNVGIWDRVLADLAVLSHMAGAEDGDVERWQGRYEDFKGRVAELRENLKVLDAEELKLSEADQGIHTTSLAELSSKVDQLDVDVIRWRGVLASQGQGLQNMRDRLSVLDSNRATPYASQMMMAELEPILTGYEPLVMKEEVDLQRWQKKVADSKAAIAKHSAWFADRVEKTKGTLNLKLQIKARERFDILSPLLPDDDVNAEKWGDQLSESERLTASMRERLASVLDNDKMTKQEVERARKTIDDLDEIGGLVESRDTYEAVLREKENYHADLRDKLQAYNRVAPITTDLQEALREFTRLIGSDDEEGKKWRAKNAEYQRLHSSLVILDQKFVVSEQVEKDLHSLAALISYTDKDVIRWKDKIEKVRDLEKALDPLERAESLPAEAQGLLDSLAELTGSRDKRFQKWQAKVTRVGELKEALAVLNIAYVLPEDSEEQMNELLTLVGEKDDDMVYWLPIVKRLIGPPKPAWANDFGRDKFGLYADVVIDEISYRFRYVPAGSFNIGSPEDQDGRDYDEGQVPITLTKGFWIAEQECIQTLYAALTYDNPYPSKFVGGERPVERVSWHDAQAFIAQFNQRLKLPPNTARLPYEAEWEYACRVGNEVARFIDDEGNDTEVDMVAWYFTNANEKTQSVKGRVANALGLYDMHGNVWEWCHDNYGGYPPAGAVDPTGGAQDEYVIRGGSFYDFEETCRAANRLGIDGDMRTMFVGFRIAISIDMNESKPEENAEPVDPIADEPIEETPEPDEQQLEEDMPAVKEEDLELSQTDD